MKHVFKCQRLGWDSSSECVWFDEEFYTQEQAYAEFIERTGMTEKANGESYPYTYWERDGIKYYSVTYMGLYSDDQMP